MWKFPHLLVRITTTRPILHPRPSPKISNRILPLAIPSQEFFPPARVFPGKLEFEDTEDAVGLCAKSINGDYFRLVGLGGRKDVFMMVTHKYFVPGRV